MSARGGFPASPAGPARSETFCGPAAARYGPAAPLPAGSAPPMPARLRSFALLPAALLCGAVLTPAAPADESLAGRACRSVHLRWPAAPAAAFSQDLVVEASDPGTYFMACGWGRGYFGIQERTGGRGKVVLFSVWDRPAGDDPDAVPEDRRVAVRHAGDDVRVGRFGNEGTGRRLFWRTTGGSATSAGSSSPPPPTAPAAPSTPGSTPASPPIKSPRAPRSTVIRPLGNG